MGQLVPGQSLAGGRYTIERSLSRGGMGAIDLAVDHDAFDRHVVIKTLLDPETPADPAEEQAARERFEREARTLAALRFPTIPRIYSCFREGGRIFIAMEYIEGTDLSVQLSRDDETTGQHIPGRAAPITSVVRWGIAMCRTLEYLAAREPPVVHQDIKPANLILARDSGELYLVDFGAARLRPATVPGGGKTAIFGTPGYAAPEQFQGQSEPRSDVYALAATLYHLATDDDPGEHLFDFPRLAHMGYIGQILRGALQRDPTARPSATELRVQLETLQMVEGRRPLRTPDGSVLFAERELSHWCERNWREAAVWLYDKLPEQLETDWVRPDLARTLRHLTQPHATEPDRGLDAVLARLDPRGYGAAAPQLQADRPALDLGDVFVGVPLGTHLELKNVGGRYLEATVEHPAWLRVRPTAFALIPGETVRLDFEATQVMSPSRPNIGTLLISSPNRQLLAVRVEGRTTPPQRRISHPGVQGVLLASFLSMWLLIVFIVWLASALT